MSLGELWTPVKAYPLVGLSLEIIDSLRISSSDANLRHHATTERAHSVYAAKNIAAQQ